MPVGAYLVAFGAMLFSAVSAATWFYIAGHLDSGAPDARPAAPAVDVRQPIAV
jgi:hypothetical protein